MSGIYGMLVNGLLWYNIFFYPGMIIIKKRHIAKYDRKMSPGEFTLAYGMLYHFINKNRLWIIIMA